MMRHPMANLLVIRRVFRTLKDSCWADLRWATLRLGVSHLWRFRQSPLEATYLPTGQTIFFRGLDDAMKINSISTAKGRLCWVWIEEAFELQSETDFDMLDEAIRGQVPDGLFKQITLTFNPWDERHWLKKRFFDAPPAPDILAMTVDFRTNEFLDTRDLALFAEMEVRNPRRYQVAGLGHWGVHEGLIFDHWRRENFDRAALLARTDIQPVFGLDFGFSNDPTALFCGAVDASNSAIYVWDELYARGLTNTALFAAIADKNLTKETILADCAEPKSIAELQRLGLKRIRGVKKGADSVRFGIARLQDYEIIVHPRCEEFIHEISSYVWDKDERSGVGLNRPDPRAEDHLMDAMRYAMEDFSTAPRFSF